MPPQDTAQDMRSEMLAAMARMGCVVEKHHHEVASAQHELGLKFAPLTVMADRLIIYKYCIQQVAQVYGKTATFMPKPIYGDNGSGMHCHQSIWKGGKPVFAGNKYADLSDTCLQYIAGIIKHAKAINAFSNPTTNSYKRLVPGFEAPVLLAYSARNRSASCRIPYTTNPKAKRVEVRFPDPLANPYLAFAAMLMAGLDGIKNKLDPGEAIDKDLYDLPPKELKKIPTVCGSLRQALEELNKDRTFLKAGGVFDDDFIDSYIDLKMSGSHSLRAHASPGRVRYVLLGVVPPPGRQRQGARLRDALRPCATLLPALLRDASFPGAVDDGARFFPPAPAHRYGRCGSWSRSTAVTSLAARGRFPPGCGRFPWRDRAHRRRARSIRRSPSTVIPPRPRY